MKISPRDSSHWGFFRQVGTFPLAKSSNTRAEWCQFAGFRLVSSQMMGLQRRGSCLLGKSSQLASFQRGFCLVEESCLVKELCLVAGFCVVTGSLLLVMMEPLLAGFLPLAESLPLMMEPPLLVMKPPLSVMELPLLMMELPLSVMKPPLSVMKLLLSMMELLLSMMELPLSMMELPLSAMGPLLLMMEPSLLAGSFLSAGFFLWAEFPLLAGSLLVRCHPDPRHPMLHRPLSSQPA